MSAQSEKLTFHFEGALSNNHQMNFYESSRFQYAAARLFVKLSQFRQNGRFSKKITNKSNYDIRLNSQSDGSFNVNIEVKNQEKKSTDPFMDITIADLFAYVGERIIGKLDENKLKEMRPENDELDEGTISPIESIIRSLLNGDTVQDNATIENIMLAKRRAAEIYREKTLEERRSSISKIDAVREQKLIAMSAPLISDMATALRRSADTLEVRTTVNKKEKSIFFLDQEMAKEIETAKVDDNITPLLGDIAQFNKENGWGKLKINDGEKTVTFSIPSDILPNIRQKLIDEMKRDKVYLQTYLVKDRSGEIIRLIVVGILQTPKD